MTAHFCKLTALLVWTVAKCVFLTYSMMGFQSECEDAEIAATKRS